MPPVVVRPILSRSRRRGAPGRTFRDVQWSPDGSLIAFVSNDGIGVGMHLNVVQPDGSSLCRVLVGASLGGGAFEWSPYGKRLAIVVPTGVRSRDLFVVNADGTDLHRIARCRCDLRVDISGRGNTISTIRPDGSGVIVVARQPARGVTGYWYPRSPLWRPTRKN